MNFFYKVHQIQEVVSVKLKALIKWDGAVVVCWKVGLLVCFGICPRTFLTALYTLDVTAAKTFSLLQVMRNTGRLYWIFSPKVWRQSIGIKEEEYFFTTVPRGRTETSQTRLHFSPVRYGAGMSENSIGKICRNPTSAMRPSATEFYKKCP